MPATLKIGLRLENKMTETSFTIAKIELRLNYKNEYETIIILEGDAGFSGEWHAAALIAMIKEGRLEEAK